MMMRPVQGLGGAPGMYPDQQYQNLQAEEHRHKQNEHRAEMGALGTAVFAAHEKHEEKVDPEHAQRHHMEAQAAEAATLGLGGYALYEHHEAHTMHKAEKHEKHDHKHDHHHCHWSFLGSTKVFEPVVDDLEELLVSAKTESDTLSILQNIL
jgi:hypothetical protein